MRLDNQGNSGVITSDESLVLLARAGDRHAFAQLWQRHAASGLRVARQFTSSIDADDLVSEAYARIYQRVLAGGGPEGAFRPYLYTTIRNLASRWGQTRHDVNVDDIGEFEDPATVSDPVSVALDRTLTVRAFRCLPDRWQAVLWYTEVEGMDPHEVAPLLGISANSVAALSYRAREGLRKAWLQAHISDATRSGECQWSITRLGDYARNGLTSREKVRVSDHLATCTKCLIISEEVDEVGSRLALVMLPFLLGGVAGGSLLASLSAPSAATAAGISLSATMPPAFGALGSVGAASVPAVAAGLAIPALSAPVLVTLALALVVSGGIAIGAPEFRINDSSTSAVSVSSGTAGEKTVGDRGAGDRGANSSDGGDSTVDDPPMTPADGLMSVVNAPTSSSMPTDNAGTGISTGSAPFPSGLPGLLPTIPSVTVPSLALPSLTVPSLTLPSLTLPSLTVPSLTLPLGATPPGKPGVVPAPALAVPQISLPQISILGVRVTPVTIPRLTVLPIIRSSVTPLLVSAPAAAIAH